MPDGRQFSLQIRIGSFILAGLGVFLAIIYLLGAQARYFERKYELIAELRTGVCDTAIVVTHDIEFADMVADRMAILYHGRFAGLGPPAEIHRSANPDVRRFLAGELRGT